MEELNYLEIDKVYERISKFILKTPLINNEYIDNFSKAKVYIKLENLQKTGSFKLRGACNKIIQLTDQEKAKGIVAYSSGNHAQAVSYASSLFKTHATIVMPKNAPLIKINNTKKFGAKIVFYDPLKESREKIASQIAFEEGKKIIKPYDDLDIIAGQGTLGKEISEELSLMNIKPDIYLCCCGGGGLLAGSATYLKQTFPDVKIFSVEPKDFNDTELSLKKKSIVANNGSAKSICDALLATQPGDLTFPINMHNLTEGLCVSDNEVKKAIITIAENLKILAEPGGAVAVAALLSKKINFEDKNVVVVISGGNIDYSFFSSIITKKNT